MDHARHRFNATVALIVTLVLLVALATACSAQATAGSGGPLAPSPSGTQGDVNAGTIVASGAGAAKGGASGADWARVLDILAFMKADPPSAPVVLLLGGSAARESTISDSSWRAQIVSRGGPATLAWNMGSRNRTMAQNVAIVQNLPRGTRAIVYIGINLGSFTSAQKRASITLPSTAAPQVSLSQPHQYSVKKGVLSKSKKRALLTTWLAKRYPVYKRNFATSAGVLERLIKVCQTRGYKPVLFELPRNTAVIGSSLNAPTTKYRGRCRKLAAKYKIPWVSLVKAAKLPNSSFYDLWHLVEPGRNVWQRLLSAKTAALLKQYGYDDGGS